MKNKLPGGIDKKIPARFFFSPNPTRVDGSGGESSGRREDRLRGVAVDRFAERAGRDRTHYALGMGISSLSVGGEWVPVNSKHPRSPPCSSSSHAAAGGG